MSERLLTVEEFQTLIESLGESPETVRQLTASLPKTAITWKPSAWEFSALEHVCHLKDLEEEGYGLRIRKLLDDEEPFLSDIDGSRLAIERNYNGQEMEVALAAFTRARQSNLALMKDLTTVELKRSGTLENVGRITLEKLLQMMREHDSAHLDELHGLSQRLKKS
jgi:hypothetical protein